ncbi:MAG: hypothetical protein HYZ83_07660, partial [Candidatus Omnitrophica bacterium]|nr:hypothetical protein [Candidatus Omnitrophota bacterium]
PVMEYLERSNIPRELAAVVTPEIVAALEDDRSLRPAFLLQISAEKEPSKYLGPLEYLNTGVLNLLKTKGIPGDDFLDKFSGFSIGTAEDAVRALQEGHHILVGVTDRYDNVNNLQNAVANGRQAYFPLGHGLWLGVKGSGQFLQEQNSQGFSFQQRENALYPFIGLVNLKEARIAHEFFNRLEAGNQGTARNQIGGPFVQFLGARKLLAIPTAKQGFDGWDLLDEKFGTSGKGEHYVDEDQIFSFFHFPKADNSAVSWIEITESMPAESSPMLVFNLFTGPPGRISKLPQILLTDPGLTRTRRQLSETLNFTGELRGGKILSPIEMFEYIAVNWALGEAQKANIKIQKDTFHFQDLTFGQEADNEENIPWALPSQPYFSQQGWYGVEIKLRSFHKIYAGLRDSNSGEAISFEEYQRLVRLFFKTYFEHLNRQDLETIAGDLNQPLSQQPLQRLVYTVPSHLPIFEKQLTAIHGSAKEALKKRRASSEMRMLSEGSSAALTSWERREVTKESQRSFGAVRQKTLPRRFWGVDKLIGKIAGANWRRRILHSWGVEPLAYAEQVQSPAVARVIYDYRGPVSAKMADYEKTIGLAAADKKLKLFLWVDGSDNEIANLKHQIDQYAREHYGANLKNLAIERAPANLWAELSTRVRNGKIPAGFIGDPGILPNDNTIPNLIMASAPSAAVEIRDLTAYLVAERLLTPWNGLQMTVYTGASLAGPERWAALIEAAMKSRSEIRRAA